MRVSLCVRAHARVYARAWMFVCTCVRVPSSCLCACVCMPVCNCACRYVYVCAFVRGGGVILPGPPCPAGLCPPDSHPEPPKGAGAVSGGETRAPLQPVLLEGPGDAGKTALGGCHSIWCTPSCRSSCSSPQIFLGKGIPATRGKLLPSSVIFRCRGSCWCGLAEDARSAAGLPHGTAPFSPHFQPRGLSDCSCVGPGSHFGFSQGGQRVHRAGRAAGFRP